MKQLCLVLTKCLITINIVLLSNNHVNGYNYLSVQNPHGWDWDQGSIEKASFIIEPKGLYMQCEMELTLSAAGTYMDDETYELEATLEFELPKGSMITQAYLLIEDSMVKARLMEQWAAESIYENIVQRVRRDPLLLKKTRENTYTAKIYPMAGNSNRTFKIKYLAPAKWTEDITSVIIPTDILNASKTKIEEANIIVSSNREWENIKIQELSEIKFENILIEGNNCNSIKKAIIHYNNNSFTPLTIEFNSPLTNGIYFNTYDIGGKGYYQLAILPSKIVGNEESDYLSTIIESYQILVSASNGFSYSQYNLNDNEIEYMSQPILQIGKYYGSFPMHIQVNIVTNEGIYMDTLIIEKSDIYTLNESIMLAWTGNTINYLENNFYDNETIEKILSLSIESNILSRYTAFIALEPGMSYEVPEEESEWEFEMMPALGVEEYNLNTTVHINPYPNPFSSVITINVKFNDQIDLSKLELKIISLNGEIIKTFNLNTFGFGDEISIEWNGETDSGIPLDKGVYILCVITPEKTSSIKIIKID